MDISIIIVNYETKHKTLNCLESISESVVEGISIETIVVDNGSKDGIEEEVREKHADVKLILSDTNLGMGKGNNLGLKEAQGEYILILNADTQIKPRTIAKLYYYIKAHPKVGIVAPELLHPDGMHQDSCFRFPSFFMPLIRRTFLGRIFQHQLNRFTMKDFGAGNLIVVDWIMGSCLMIRRSALECVGGGFDKRFFMYLEDTDLCRRMWQAGFKVVYMPEAQVIHDHGRGSAKKPWYIAPFTEPLAREHIKSWLKYFLKWGIR